MDSLLGMEQKRALVIGAGQGIGRMASLRFAQSGCDIALVDLEGDRIASVADEVRELGRKATLLVGDVTREEDAERLVGEAVTALGGIDALVNIVGMAGWSSLLDLDVAAWDREQDINLKHHFLVTRAVARHMVERGGGGTVALVASVSGQFGAPNHGAYGAAKAGLMALVKTMAEEWAPHGIRVNAVAPGSVLTPRIQAMRESGELKPAKPDEVDRMCEPDDIACGLLFLSSALARRVNGQTLVVDGGKTTMFPFDLG